MDTKRMRDAANEQLTRVGMRTEDLVRWRQETHPEKVLALLDENDSLRAELAATRRELERWRHSEQIEGDYVCPAEQLLEQRDEVIRENDSLRAEVERLGKLRDIIERLAQFNEEEAKAWILSEYGARKAGAAVALRSVLREFDSIGKDGGNE